MFRRKILKEVKLKNGAGLTVLQITKTKDEMLTKNDIDKIKMELEKKTGAENVLIRGLNGIGFTTLKGYNQDYDDYDYEDYFNNKVKDDSNFSQFFQLEITIKKPKK
jgi:hypothetical protein